MTAVAVAEGAALGGMGLFSRSLHRRFFCFFEHLARPKTSRPMLHLRSPKTAACHGGGIIVFGRERQRESVGARGNRGGEGR